MVTTLKTRRIYLYIDGEENFGHFVAFAEYISVCSGVTVRLYPGTEVSRFMTCTDYDHVGKVVRRKQFSKPINLHVRYIGSINMLPLSQML